MRNICNDATKRDAKWMNFLYYHSLDLGFNCNSRIVAAMVVKNELIAIGDNSGKSHPFQDKFKKRDGCIYLHAEVNTIHKSLKRIYSHNTIPNTGSSILKKATLYVCRTKRDNSWGLAKPCSGCQRAILEFGVGRVVYSTGNFEEWVEL